MGKGNEDQEQMDGFWVDDEEEDAGTLRSKYLFFNLGNELYGINIKSITEIIEMLPITEVPDMPVYIKGVINLRGKVIPVMDLRLRFRMPEREYDDRNCIIVTRVEDASLGMIVDTVAEVHDIAADDIEQAPNYADEGKANYVEGVGKVEDRVTVLIDARKILRANELKAVTASG